MQILRQSNVEFRFSENKKFTMKDLNDINQEQVNETEKPSTHNEVTETPKVETSEISSEDTNPVAEAAPIEAEQSDEANTAVEATTDETINKVQEEPVQEMTTENPVEEKKEKPVEIEDNTVKETKSTVEETVQPSDTIQEKTQEKDIQPKDQVETEPTEEKPVEHIKDTSNETGAASAISELVSNAVLKEETSKEESKDQTKGEDTVTELSKDETPAEAKTPVAKNEEKQEKTPVSANDNDESDEDDIDDNDISNYLEEDDAGEDEEKIDYSTYSKEELVNILADKLENAPVQDIKYDIDNIKSNFYKKLKAEIDLAKKKFLTDGGDPAEFVFEGDALEDRLKDLLNEYKHLKTEFNKNLELEKEANLKKKYEIIEAIKELINGQESINKTFNDFRELQNQWREIGLVPQAEVHNLWENYHHNVEQFYDYIKINRELRDLDLKKNLESKVKLCEQAEELMMEPSVVKAFKQLQKLHEQWREIGPVAQDNRDDIWERFKAVTTSINKAHQEYFDTLKQEQTNNLNAKIALCEKAEEIANEDYGKHKDWENKSDELIEVQKLWKTIGFATKKENNKVFERFRAACDMFFNKKRDFYFEHKEIQNNNLQLKTELCMQAEAIKNSTDWKKTTDELIKLQKDWKGIGPVPRKQSDTIWKRFRAACNEFFENKKNHFENIDKEYDTNLKAKEELIEKVKSFEQQESIEENINLLKGYQKEWTEIGHVPFKLKDKIQKEFRDAVNEQFDKLKIDSDKRSVIVYKQKLETISQGNKANRQYRIERDRIIDNIRQMESDIVLLENNIGFFAKTKNAEALIKDVNQKIEKAKRRIKTEKQKLDLINKFE